MSSRSHVLRRGRWGLGAAALLGSTLIGAVAPAGATTPMPFPAATSTISQDHDRPPVRGDFDGDNRDDLLWYSGRPGVDAIWFSSPEGGHAVVPLNVGPGFAVTSADVSGDGVDELLWSTLDDAAPLVIWSGFRYTRTFRGSFGPIVPAGARTAVADLDGDRAQDVFFFNPSGADALLYGSPSEGLRLVPGNVDGNFATTVGDLNGDGADELVWYDDGSGVGVIWWGGSTLVGSSLAPGAGFRLRVGDLDGDGASDLVWHRPNGPTVLWYGQPTRTQVGRFVGRLVAQGGDFEVVVADVERNGRDDLVLLGAGGGPNYVWLSRAEVAGGFDYFDAPAGGAGEPLVADGNGDGTEDILFNVAGPGSDTWWQGFPHAPATLASGVTNLSAGGGGGSGEVALRWDAVAGATGYRVLRAVEAADTFEVAATIDLLTGTARVASNVIYLASDTQTFVPTRNATVAPTAPPTRFEYIELLTDGAPHRSFRVVAIGPGGASPASPVVCGAVSFFPC